MENIYFSFNRPYNFYWPRIESVTVASLRTLGSRYAAPRQFAKVQLMFSVNIKTV